MQLAYQPHFLIHKNYKILILFNFLNIVSSIIDLSKFYLSFYHHLIPLKFKILNFKIAPISLNNITA